MPINFPLGWNNPSGSILTGPDAASLRRIFESLSLWLSFPLIGVSRENQAIPAGALTPIAWTTEILDEHQLHDAGAATWRVPAQFRTYLAVGAVGVNHAAAAAAAVSQVWTLNGAATLFGDTTATGVFGSSCSTPFVKMVARGSTIGVSVFQLTGGPLEIDAEAWMMFLPMGS